MCYLAILSNKFGINYKIRISLLATKAVGHPNAFVRRLNLWPARRKLDLDGHDKLREHVRFGDKTLVLLICEVGLIEPFLVEEIDDVDNSGRTTLKSRRYQHCLETALFALGAGKCMLATVLIVQIHA